MQKKLKIYLCDLVHDYSGVGSHTFPLNIGYIASYAKKFFQGDVDFELIKYPEDLLELVKKEAPDMVGFSHYTWNADLNSRMASWIKSVSPETVVVYGGPNINYSEKGYKTFFEGNKAADFYVLYQGEIAFLNILNAISSRGLEASALKSDPIDGVVFYSKEKNAYIKGGNIARIKEMDSIPSPYLTGIFDKFFDTKLIPIVETNRGCPYRCTYCCQGMSSGSQIEFFDLGRVKDELRYIATRIKNTNILLFADSNFGILERDLEIAKYIAELMEETGYPRRVSMNWAKNQPKVFEIAKILKNINMVISLQSLDEEVLKNIKRQNIGMSYFKNIIDEVNKSGGMSGTEIILALPGETKESHLASLRKLFDWNVSYVICYNCLILEGSEMSMAREKGEFECKTKFRLIDNSFGKYGGIASFEAEEGIRQLPTMSEEQILYFRPVHWLIQFMWNYRFYYDFLKYLQALGINPVDYIISLIDNVDGVDTPESVKQVFRKFNQEARDEWYESPEDMRKHYMEQENFEWLEKGNYGKMNSKFVFQTLLEAKEEFENYLFGNALKFAECAGKEENISAILKFHSASIVDFRKNWDEIIKGNDVALTCDIVEWQKSGYQKNLDELHLNSEKTLVFQLPEEQQKSLAILLKQYSHPNMNVTLRKMSEFMDIRDFFYKVKS